MQGAHRGKENASPAFTPRGVSTAATSASRSSGDGGGEALAAGGEVGFIRGYLDRIARLEKEIRRLKEVRVVEGR